MVFSFQPGAAASKIRLISVMQVIRLVNADKLYCVIVFNLEGSLILEEILTLISLA